PARSHQRRCSFRWSGCRPPEAPRRCRRRSRSAHGCRSRFLLVRPGVALVVLVPGGRVVTGLLFALPRVHGVLAVALLDVAVLGHGLADDGLLVEPADAVVLGVPALVL